MMRRSRGFLTPSLYAALGAAVLILALGGLAWVQTSRLDALRKEYAEFKGGVEALGRAAKTEADRKTAADRTKKEQADAERAKERAGFISTIAGLRAERAGRSFVPAAASGSSSPDRAAFDRAELERALRDFDTSVQGIADEGSKAVIDLDTAKRWAQR